ncbi:MAG: hypothetical protein EA419_05340 [Wenzhouxiangella sp.]|nr:MAG: hypothetical protein EA419_05340 [Wenzhouxiangella sp.]
MPTIELCLPARAVQRAAAILLTLVLATACASSPVAPENDDVVGLGPAHVLSGDAEPGDRVIWGGRIASIRNLADRTELTVVSYPLDRGDRPRLNQDPGVRFLLRYPDFLEPAQYVPGRFVTVLGTVEGLEVLTVDEHELRHPVLDGERLHLWPADASRWQSQTRFSIGVGIRL